MIVVAALLVLVVQSTASQQADSIVRPAGYRCRADFVLDGIRTELILPSSFIMAGSESVFVTGERFGDYLIDADRGLLVLLRRFPPWTPVSVTYWCAGFTGLSVRSSSWPVVAPAESRLTKLELPDSLQSGEDHGLTVSGYKTIGVSFGSSGGPGIEQVTRIGLAGEVAGVIVDAELSDQSSPISPEGTTRDIEEFDRIVISAKGRNWQGVLGDVGVGIDAGDFGTIRRRAVGAQVSAEPWGQRGESDHGLKLSGTYARPRGRYGRVLLNGSDGVQGPYRLLPPGRSEQIVPASERVYLDGRLLTRGWDQDYTIDYSAGEVFFASRRIIDRLSRIEVEFQYVTESFQRSVMGGMVELQPGPGRVALAVVREADDPERRLLGELVPEEREYLARIGGDTSRAWLSGASFVGAGAGEYVAEGDHFRYVGIGAGDYDVQFTFVGDSLGRYVYDDSLLGFRYVGEGMGAYIDSVRVQLPQADAIGYVQGAMRHDRALLQADAAFARRSLNLFSRDGGRFDAAGLSICAAWVDSNARVEVRHVQQAPGFSLPSERRAPDFTRRWAGTTEEKRRFSDEVVLGLRPWSWMEFDGDLGRLVRSDCQSVERWAARAKLGWLVGAVERVSRRRSRYVGLVPLVGLWKGELGWREESDSAGYSRIWSSGLEFRVREHEQAILRCAGARYQLTTHGGIAAASDGRSSTELVHRLQVSSEIRAGEVLQSQADAGFERFLSAVSENGDRLFGSGRVSISPLRGMRLVFDAGQSNRRVQLYSERFRYVGQGRGTYSRDSLTGRLFPDPDGDYERILTPTGRFVSAREFLLSGSAEVLTFSWFGLTSSFSRSATGTDSGSTGEAFRYDLRATSGASEPLLSGSLGMSGEASFDKTLIVSGRHDVRHTVYAEGRSSRLAELELGGRVELAKLRRWYTETLLDHDESSWKLELTPVVGSRLRLELTTALEQSSIAEPAAYPELGTFRLSSLEVRLARVWNLAERMRARISGGGVLRVASVSTLPFDVSLTRPLGITPSIAVQSDYVVGRLVDISTQYSFSRRPDRAAEHVFSSQLRAYF